MSLPESPAAATPSTKVVKEVLDDARELIALEVRLATAEMKDELLRTKHAAIAGVAAFSALLLGLAAALVALILALGAGVGHALLVALVLFVMAAASASYAYSAIPKNPLEKTRKRLVEDAKRLKEHAV